MEEQGLAAAVVEPEIQTIHKLEAYCLGIIMRHPDLIYWIDRSLKQAGLEPLSGKDFQLTNHQILFRVTKKALDQDYVEPLHHALDNLPMPLAEFTDEILKSTEDIDPEDEKVLIELLTTILRIRQNSLQQQINQIRFMMEDAQEQGVLRNESYEKTVYDNTITLLKINKALDNRSLNTTINH